MTEQSVRVEVELGVQRDDLAVAGQDQRVDFSQRSVGFIERLVQALQRLAGLRHARVGHADLAGDVVGFSVGQADRRLDDQGVDLFRAVGSDFFDVHAAFARGHQRDLLRNTVHHQRNVQFLLDVGAFFDQQAVDLLAFRAGLVLVDGAGSLHPVAALALHAVALYAALGARSLRQHIAPIAAALAAATRMNLSLDDPHRAAERFCGLQGLVNRERGDAARNRHIVFAQDFLALILMDIHACFLSGRRKR